MNILVIAFLAGSYTLILVKKTGLHIQNLDKKSYSSITGGYLTARFIDCQNLYELLKKNHTY
jgi:hypothetical protein